MYVNVSIVKLISLFIALQICFTFLLLLLIARVDASSADVQIFFLFLFWESTRNFTSTGCIRRNATDWITGAINCFFFFYSITALSKPITITITMYQRSRILLRQLHITIKIFLQHLSTKNCKRMEHAE
jgi:hypothetical protein